MRTYQFTLTTIDQCEVDVVESFTGSVAEISAAVDVRSQQIANSFNCSVHVRLSGAQLHELLTEGDAGYTIYPLH